jgi:hypothetical protein
MRRKLTYDPQRDYYAILGIDSRATQDELRLAYRRAVRAVHPDLNPERAEWATEQLKLVNEAYDTLKQPRIRREYDQLRWPHVPTQPRAARESYRSPYRAPHYDPDRPWWEQATTFRSRRRASFYRAASRKQPPPFWMTVRTWLNKRGLHRVESVWMGMVGMWRGPYTGLLMMLGFLLALNVAVIVYAFVEPQDGWRVEWWDDMLPDWTDTASTPEPADTVWPTVAPTPDRLHSPCTDPAVEISAPDDQAVVPQTFDVIGAARPPEMWNYSVRLGYLGSAPRQVLGQPAWETIRPSPARQSGREDPVTDGLLATVDLRGKPSGYYVLRLQVELQKRGEFRTCDVVIQWQP